MHCASADWYHRGKGWDLGRLPFGGPRDRGLTTIIIVINVITITSITNVITIITITTIINVNTITTIINVTTNMSATPPAPPRLFGPGSRAPRSTAADYIYIYIYIYI